MRRLIAACAVLFAATSAFAAGPGAPVYWHGDGLSAIFKAGVKPMSVTRGDTPLHQPVTFNCSSTVGCVVTINASDLESGTIGTYLCGLVDSEAAVPGCSYGGSGTTELVNEIHEQKRVAPGRHTLVLDYHSNNTTGTMSSWEVEYRIYQRSDE
jgi:hypothetical protein